MPQTFLDRHGRPWELQITVSAAKRAKALLGVNLYTLNDDKFAGLRKLTAPENSDQLVDLVYVILKPQADARTLPVLDSRGNPVLDDSGKPKERPFTDEDFGDAVAGDALADLGEAFHEALIDFFPDRGARSTLRKISAKAREVQALARQQVEEKLEQTSPDDLLQILNETSGKPPESAASTPDPEPTAS